MTRFGYHYRHRRATCDIGRVGCWLLAVHDARMERRLEALRARWPDRWAGHDIETENGREIAGPGDP